MAVTKCHIELEKSFCTPEHITQLRDACLSWGGSCKVELLIREGEEEGDATIACGGEFSVRFCDDFVAEGDAGGDYFGGEPMAKATVAPTGFLGAAAGIKQELGIFLLGSASVAFFDIRADGIGTGDLL